MDMGIVELFFDNASLDQEAVNEHGENALMLAAFNNHFNVVSFLLNKSSLDVNSGDYTGTTALHIAADIAMHDSLEMLVKCPDVVVNAADNKGMTALMLAAGQRTDYGDGDIFCEVVNLLLQRPDIQVNLADSEGDTALHMAAKRGDITTFKAIFCHPRVKRNVVNKNGWTALMCVVQLGSVKFVEWNKRQLM